MILEGFQQQALLRYVHELHETTDPAQFHHLAVRAECPGEIGHIMRELVEHERALRGFNFPRVGAR